MAKTTVKKGIGYSPLSQKVYLGKQNKEKSMWVGDKEDITSDFINVMFQYVDKNNVRRITNVDGLDETFFMNVANDKVSIEKAIKYLQKHL